jgi:hypothetical protein
MTSRSFVGSWTIGSFAEAESKEVVLESGNELIALEARRKEVALINRK